MGKIRIILFMAMIAIGVNLYGQDQSETMRVYAELLGSGTNFMGLNKNVKVTVDMGQPQSSLKGYTLQDENNKDIKFNSMVAAMNYMGQRGWIFVQTYSVSHGKNLIYHWLMYKDVKDESEIMDGLNIKNLD